MLYSLVCSLAAGGPRGRRRKRRRRGRRGRWRQQCGWGCGRRRLRRPRWGGGCCLGRRLGCRWGRGGCDGGGGGEIRAEHKLVGPSGQIAAVRPWLPLPLPSSEEKKWRRFIVNLLVRGSTRQNNVNVATLLPKENPYPSPKLDLFLVPGTMWPRSSGAGAVSRARRAARRVRRWAAPSPAAAPTCTCPAPSSRSAGACPCPGSRWGGNLTTPLCALAPIPPRLPCLPCPLPLLTPPRPSPPLAPLGDEPVQVLQARSCSRGGPAAAWFRGKRRRNGSLQGNGGSAPPRHGLSPR